MDKIVRVVRHTSENRPGRDDLECVGWDEHLLGCASICNSIQIGDDYHPLSRLIRNAVNHFRVSALFWNSLSFDERGCVMRGYIEHLRSVAEDDIPISLALALKKHIKDESLLIEFSKRSRK